MLLLFFDVNAVDSFRTMLRGVDMMSELVSKMPDENDLTELLEFERALVLILADVEFTCGGFSCGLDVFAVKLFTVLSDFFEADDEDLGLPMRPKEKRLAMDSFSLGISSAMSADKGSASWMGLLCVAGSSSGASFRGGERGFSGFMATCC